MTRRLLPLALPVLLSACMVGPDYHRPPAPIPVVFKELAGWKPAVPRDDADRGAWWSIYQDPILDTLERQVDISNYTLQAAEAAYRQAVAIMQEARAQLFPVLGLNANVIRSGSGPGTGGIVTSGGSAVGIGAVIQKETDRTFYTFQGTGSWDLDVWGAIRRTIESDVSGAQASAADVANARLSAQAALATAYYNLRAADSLTKLLSDLTVQYQRAYDITRNEYEGGVAVRSDMLNALALLQETQAQLINVGVQRAQYEHAIAVLTGRPPAALIIAPTGLPQDVPVMPAMVPAELLERRPDIAAAERAMEQQNSLIGVAIAAFYPTVTLSALGGFTGYPLDTLISAPTRLWSLGAAAADPLFEGGARSAAVDSARAAYDNAVATYRQTVLTAFQQVEDELAALRILGQESGVADAAVRSVHEAAVVSLNEYEQGTVIYTTVITAQELELQNAETALTVLQNRMLASVALVEALGGGWRMGDLPSKDELQRGLPFMPAGLGGPPDSLLRASAQPAAP
jgi:NodT family efflux transporter outer membrane factor (OMF) lipoprotein